MRLRGPRGDEQLGGDLGVGPAVCDEAGEQQVFQGTCDPDKLENCRDDKCLNLCNEAQRNRNNVDYEY